MVKAREFMAALKKMSLEDLNAIIDDLNARSREIVETRKKVETAIDIKQLEPDAPPVVLDPPVSALDVIMRLLAARNNEPIRLVDIVKETGLKLGAIKQVLQGRNKSKFGSRTEYPSGATVFWDLAGKVADDPAPVSPPFSDIDQVPAIPEQRAISGLEERIAVFLSVNGPTHAKTIAEQLGETYQVIYQCCQKPRFAKTTSATFENRKRRA
jgi:hypothetical protein